MLGPFLNLLFPPICFACGCVINGKIKHICIQCRNELSKTSLLSTKENPVEKLLWGRTMFTQATSYLKFEQNGKIQHLLHSLKYKGIKAIGHTLGELSALEISKTGFFDSIDVIVPVPIHKKKKRKRGYNQSLCIAEGIASVTGIPIDSKSLVKNYNTKSQTKKTRYQRFENVNHSFGLRDNQQLAHKHILLVDDVITTGATIEACSSQLKALKEVQLSLLTIACTY